MNLSNKLKSYLLYRMPKFFWGRLYFSQEGEDAVVFKILNKRDGRYIDVGCNHPIINSNTYFFYRRGWKGVCIDAAPGTKKLFKKYRPRDTVFECGVSDKSEELTYNVFKESLINTFSEVEAKKRLQEGYIPSEKLKFTTFTVGDIVSNTSYSKFDLITVDVEGFDLAIIKTIDFKKYQAEVVIVEDLYFNLNQEKDSENISNIMLKNNYYFYAKTGNSLIFKKHVE